MNNLTDKEAAMAVLEDLTSNVKQIQDQVLEEILTSDANTEYLRSFLHGSSDKELFKKNVPVGTYEDFKPYIERVVNGEPSDVISGKPITGFILTSGTSGGKQKLIPLNNKYLENARLLFDLRYLVLSKDSVSKILGGPNPQLADTIEEICNQKSWKGIIPQLWPKTKFIECIVTGQMAQHIPLLEFYVNNLPLVSPTYASSEASFGINLNPLCKPQDVSYTLLPNMSYFEFLPVNGENGAIVDLVNVKLGGYYELIVTNYSGLHRCRVGDVLQVTGFYNSAPQFRFVRRQNVVLSVYLEATTEEDLLKGVTRATQVLKSSDIMLRDFTCYPHVSDVPGHYVLYWELKGNNDDDINELIDTNVLVECCSVVEESLDSFYRGFRSMDGSIGALEIRFVQQGTFDSLMEYFIAQGASLSQYKTTRCIKSSEALEVLENRVIARVCSDKLPHVDTPC